MSSLDEFRARIAASKQKHTTAITPAPAPAPPAKRQLKLAPQRREIENVLPHAEEAEHAVLATMLQYPEQAVPEAKRHLTRDYFYNPIHAELFVTLVSLFDAGKYEASRWAIGFTQFLRDTKRLDGVGGVPYVMELASETAVPEALGYYAEILRDKFTLRELIAIGTKLRRAAFGAVDEVGEIIDDFSGWLEQVKYGALGLNGSEHMPVPALLAFDPRNDPNVLVGRRWIVRGGTVLWAGGSGYGKSALQMQLAIYWACGRSVFGLKPVHPLRSLILQAENDLGDMGEQYQGVDAGIAATQDFNLEESRALIEKNVIIHRIVGKTGAGFLAMLDSLIMQTRPDLVWIDPLFAFAGCDLMNAQATGRFLREGLFPIVVKRNVALQVLHHVGKPVRDKDESVTGMSEIDYQYLGFGTSEIQNSFRAVNVLVPIAGTHVYKLALSKRGDRAGAKDVEGGWTRTLFLEHSKEGICWLQTAEPDTDRGPGRPPTFTLKDLLAEMSIIKPVATGTLCRRLREERNMSRGTFFRLFDEGKKEGRIALAKDGGGWVRKGTDAE